MKIFAFVALIFLLPSACKISDNSTLQLKYDKVMMYEFAGGIGSDMSIVDARGHIAKSMTKQVVLDKESALSLTRKLGEKESFADTTASCFEPGLGFIYYLKGKKVAHINVCLSCNVVTSSFPVNPKKHDKFWANNDYDDGGPTQSFRAFLQGLLKKYDF